MPIVNNCTQMIPLTLFRPIEHPIDFYIMKLGLCIVYILKGHGLKFQKKKNNVWPKKGGALTTKERT